MRARRYDGRVIFQHMQLWIDPVPRSGPEAMAVDEWLLETADAPVLRVYQWLGDWGSVGYFGDLAAARSSFPGLSWVRRWTGGGTVDHRADWTYTVVAPAGEPLVKARGAESYRILHAAVAVALRCEGVDAALSTGADETGMALCFENPVSHDIVGPGGRKLAGAGQRRTRHGLLHQGSVAGACDAAASRKRAESLAGLLAADWEARECFPPEEAVAGKLRSRYAVPEWLERR
jgi:lipoate-protein ligase A